jgi:hypothetical protein
MNPAHDRSSAGFSDAGMTDHTHGMAAGVREAPRHEIAVGGALRCGRLYGDLATA